jgi:hypothetical protein
MERGGKKGNEEKLCLTYFIGEEVRRETGNEHLRSNNGS